MSFQIESSTYRWLLSLGVFSAQDSKPTKITANTYSIDQQVARSFQNGSKIAIIVQQLCRKNSIPIPQTLNHLKSSSNTAAQLYNWNILNETLKKMSFQIDSQTKNMVINGDREHLNIVLRRLQVFYQDNLKQQADGQRQQVMEDSLDNEKISLINKKTQPQPLAPPPRMQKKPSSSLMRQSLSLSHSQDPSPSNNNNLRAPMPPQQNGDLLEYIVSELIYNLKLTRKQAIALLSDNNKYLAHVLVKGIKGQFIEIDELMARFYTNIDFIIEKMLIQNDMCFFFLQIVKPSLLSKSQEIAQWGCRLLSRVAHELAEKQMLPLAYDWFVRQAGGLSTTILALSRHPKLNQHVVGYILQFSRYNVTELFTIELKKITNNDNLNYVKFMLLIFQPLVQSKLSAEQLLNSGAIDYWVEMSLKNAENDIKNTKQLRLYSIQFLIKIWRAYPIHIQETLDQVNPIMSCIKKGIRETSEIMRFSLVEMMFDLLDEFASKKNPYASIVYKKLTFLFIENHEEHSMREFMLRNFSIIFRKYTSIPVQIFLEPFIKQVKISQSKSYILDIFDMEFIEVASNHKKLKVNIGLQLYDLLAKTKLNSTCYVSMAVDNMNILLDRFVEEEQFFDYTVKLVKISLAMLYSTLKHKKQFDDQERLQAQKRAEIINFIISLIQRGNEQLNEEIKSLVVHVKLQIENKLGIVHRGIQRILSYYKDIEEAVMQAMQNIRDRDQTQSNATNKTKSTFHLPKIEHRNQLLRDRDRDQTSSQQSFQTNASKFSKITTKSKQEFPAKDYTQYAEQDEKNYVKENNIVSLASRKNAFRTKKQPHTGEKQSSMDPKIQAHINKLKQRKEQDQVKKFRQKQTMERKKQNLKHKIQKELEQRNIKDGLMGNEKDMEVQVLFEQNQLNQKLFADDEDPFCKNITVQDEEQRDAESLRLVIRRNMHFIKKVFTKYASARVVKKDYFEEKSDMNQTDLLRLCKEKNLERSKVPIIQILKQINNKNIKTISIDIFPSFLQNLCVHLYFKQKTPSHIPMGQFMHRMLKKMSVGQNTKLDDDEDEQCRILGQKIRYNPQMQLPDGFKKVHERVFVTHKETTYPVKKTIGKQSYLDCFEILTQILFDAFKFQALQEEIRFKQELKVVHKKQAYMPPKPTMSSSKREKNADQSAGFLLKDTEQAPVKNRRQSISKPNRSGSKQNFRGVSGSKDRPKIVNAAQKKKKQEQQQSRIKRQHEQQLRKIRQLQVKKKLERQTQERQAQKLKKKDEQKKSKQEQQQKKQRELEEQLKYKQKQKQKVQKYRKQQQEKEKVEKQQKRKQREKQEEQKKEKLNKLKSKEDLKRAQERQKLKKQRELSEERKQKAKQDDERKKQNLRKQVQKKLLSQKQKYETEKGVKELTKQIYAQANIVREFAEYKDQLKAMFNYGRQYNEYKLGGNSNQNNQLEVKGWLTLCQQFKICDVTTANNLMKMYQKESSFTGFSYEQFEEVLFAYQTKPVLEKEMDNYEAASQQAQKVISKFLANLSIPKDKLLMKDFFLNLKNEKGEGHNDKKKRRKSSAAEIAVTNANGDKENWELEEGDN